MSVHRLLVLSALLVGCGGTEPVDTDSPYVPTFTVYSYYTTLYDTDPTGSGACGEITTHDITLTGLVVDESANPVPDAALTLEDRGWEPGTILGTATSDYEGRYVMPINGLTAIEDCWGILLDYWLMGSKLDLTGEEGVNTYLHSATVSADLSVDKTSFPLVLEAPPDTGTTP